MAPNNPGRTSSKKVTDLSALINIDYPHLLGDYLNDLEINRLENIRSKSVITQAGAAALTITRSPAGKEKFKIYLWPW